MFTQHVLQSIYLGQTLLTSFVRLTETSLEPIFYISVSVFHAFAVTSSPHANCCLFKMLFSLGKREKVERWQVQGIWLMLQSCHIKLGKVRFDHQRPMCSCVIVQKKPVVSCPFFGMFPLSLHPWDDGGFRHSGKQFQISYWTKLRSLSPRANYIDRATAASRLS
jgi:hypothetical protein